MFFLSLNQGYAQMGLLIGTVAQLSNLAHGPLARGRQYHLFYFISSNKVMMRMRKKRKIQISEKTNLPDIFTGTFCNVYTMLKPPTQIYRCIRNANNLTYRFTGSFVMYTIWLQPTR